MKTIEIKVNGLDSPATCDLVKKEIMNQQGIIDVVVDPASKIVHVQLSDSCSCSADDVLCKLKDLGIGVGP